MKRFGYLLVLPVLLMAADQKTREVATHRLDEAAAVFTEIMGAPDKGIPHDLLDKAHCVVIVPGVKKGAFVVGGEYGKGFVTCREQAGWSAPAAIRVEGGSFGFQIGGSETDVVMLVMNDRGAQRLMTDKFTLGAEGEIAAGPVGRDASAQTDAKLTAEILSWSRTRGAFAGIALKGATLRQDRDVNQALYGMRLSTQEVLAKTTVPQDARQIVAVLNQYSPGQTARAR